MEWAESNLGPSAGIQNGRNPTSDRAHECLLRIDHYDFDWQETYLLSESMHFEPGDQLHLRCTFDNSPGNQYVIDGERLESQDVGWGDGSRDEMCLGNFLISQSE